MTFDAPAALPGSDAAAFLFPFHLAWLGLHERGRLRAGHGVNFVGLTPSQGVNTTKNGL